MQRKREGETPEAVEVPSAVEVSTIVSRKHPPPQQLKASDSPHPAPIVWSAEPEGKTATPIRCKAEGPSFGCCNVLRSTGNVEQLNHAGCFPMKTEQIIVSLEHRSLWQEFFCRGTEMIVNRAGRRMFPCFSLSVSGLKPKAKYTMTCEIYLADNHRFKFINTQWMPVGSAEAQPEKTTYVHPDSPNTGAFWMRQGISFKKLKITNNKEKPNGNVLLYSMHKYYARLVISEVKKPSSGKEAQPPRVVYQEDFPETTFIAVTAYQNEEVTQLKITNNPFAKAFRETATELEWDASQVMYGSRGMLPANCFPYSSFTSAISPYTPPYSPFCPWTLPGNSLPAIHHFSSANEAVLPDFEVTFRPPRDSQSPPTTTQSPTKTTINSS